MIAILDYGAGNLRSVQNALEEIGCEYSLVRDAAGLRAASKILLPGVGHFGQMMRALDALEVRDTLIERIAAGVPFLGICLGLQALFDASEEAPEVRGLGIFEGIVRRFPAHARVPHMGWNELELRAKSKLLRGFDAHSATAGFAADERDSEPSHDRKGVFTAQGNSSPGPTRPFVYFAHSYYVPEGDYTSAVCAYEVPYTAVLELGSVFGVQFHPEKSGPVGLAIVRNFVEC
jgi:imidazole glycerol-phosphate synthase subunit HisH